MIADARYPSDTLFLLFEEDYRFWPECEDPDNADQYQRRLQEVVQARKRKEHAAPARGSVANDPAYRAGQASSSAAGAYRPAIAATGRDEARLRSEFHYMPKRGGSEWYTPDDGLTGNIADLLRMATFAHRQGCGELIWFGWCPHEGGRHGKNVALDRLPTA